MFLHVKRVLYVKDYVLRLELTDNAVFKQASLNEETLTIEWPTGADFAPEYLYEIGRDVRQIA